MDDSPFGTASPPRRGHPTAALWFSAWSVAGVSWMIASGAALRYLHSEANIISTTWLVVAVVCTAAAALVDLRTRRARASGVGATIACLAGAVIAGLSLGFAIAQAILVSRGHAEPKGYLLTMAAVVPLVMGMLLFFSPTMVRASRRRGARPDRR